MKELLLEYKRTLKTTNKAYRQATDEEKKVLSGMISDLEYAIEWIQSGRRPYNRRGIERKAAYQRERPMDPLIMQNYFANQTVGNVGITEENRARIEDALSVLTEREREVYEMRRAGGLSHARIAELLHVSKSTIQDTLERAEKKIEERTIKSLFCMVI
jgi:positive control factor